MIVLPAVQSSTSTSTMLFGHRHPNNAWHKQPHSLITACNEVGVRLYFYRRLWFCPRGVPALGGWCLVWGGAYSQGGLLPGKCLALGGDWSGGLVPGGGAWCHGRGEGGLVETFPPEWLLLRVVRILLECILAGKLCIAIIASNDKNLCSQKTFNSSSHRYFAI